MNSKHTKKALLSSVLALVLCFAMMLGTTFAWFTDTASTGVNKIQAGTLDVALEMKEGNDWVSAEGKTLDFVKAEGHENEEILWEPGCTYTLPELRIVNKGNLALKYKVVITGINGDAKLNEAIEWTMTVGGPASNAVTLNSTTGTDSDPNNTESSSTEATEWFLLPGNENTSGTIKISGHMKEKAGNAYQGLSIEGIAITVLATQYTYEHDSSDNQYDADAEYSTTDVNTTGLLITGGEQTINTTLSISSDDTGANSDVIRVTGGDHVITGGSYIAYGTKSNSALRVDGGTVTIKGGYFEAKEDNNCIYAAGGSIIIEGGTFVSEKEYADKYWTLNAKDYSGSTITVKGGSFYKFDPSNAETAPISAPELTVAEGYKVVNNGDWYYVVPEDDNSAAMGSLPTENSSGSIVLTNPVSGDAAISSNTLSGYKTGVVLTSGVLNGNGNTLTTSQNDVGIEVAEGTIKNLTVSSAFRGIMTYNTTGAINIDNVTITDCGYGINTGSGTDNTGSLVVTNSTLGGWSSWAGLSSASFTNCKFVKGSYYNSDIYDQYLRPYVTSTFEHCDFVQGMHFDLSKLVEGATVTFKNCTCNGVVLTADNAFNYLHFYLDNSDTEPTSAEGFDGFLTFSNT